MYSKSFRRTLGGKRPVSSMRLIVMADNPEFLCLARRTVQAVHAHDVTLGNGVDAAGAEARKNITFEDALSLSRGTCVHDVLFDELRD